jgi:hypothetical protein
VREPRAFFSSTRRLRTVALVLSVVQFLLYALLVSLPDFRSQSDALAGGGAIQSIPPFLVGGLAGLTLVTTIVLRRLGGSVRPFVGTAALIVAMGLALAALLAGNRSTDWTYYPTKLGWLATILFLVILFATLAQYPGLARDNRSLAIATAVICAVGLLGTAAIAPPLPRSVAAATPFTEAISNSGAEDSYAAVLFAVSRPGDKVLLSNYGSSNEDSFVDFWLLQATSQLGTEKIRNYAYYLQPDSASDVCNAITEWHGDVSVLTTDPAWGAKLHAACSSETFSVLLSSVSSAGSEP